jgi:hypothetical protein
MSGRQFSMPYEIPPVGLLPPAADAAGRTSVYHTLKNALKAYVVCHVNQGNAATVALTLLQAQDVSGTGSKAMTATPIWLVADTSVADAMVAQAAAAGFTTSATLKDKIVVFEIEPEACMDIANGFKTVAVQTGASNASNITEAMLFVKEAYQGASAPSTLTN